MSLGILGVALPLEGRPPLTSLEGLDGLDDGLGRP
jgi:hypothetical protein